MKTLLLGGPENGKVIDTKYNVFGYGMMTEVTNTKSGKKEVSGYNYFSACSYSARHPAKKKGTLNVFVFIEGSEFRQPTKEEIKQALAAKPAEATISWWENGERKEI